MKDAEFSEEGIFRGRIFRVGNFLKGEFSERVIFRGGEFSEGGVFHGGEFSEGGVFLEPYVV